jgi:toxin-antitoxin system PIN domain toxin
VSATVDANILVYASNSSDPSFADARALVEHLARGPDLLYVFWPVLMGYLRIVTHPAILPRPLSMRDALRNIAALVDQPHVRSPGEQDGFWAIVRSVTDEQTRGNDIPDVHIAALMRQHGVRIIHTRDRGFRRFPWLEVRDPFV